MPNKQKRFSGFTLIELLIVITVIGALSGILLGVINSSGIRAKARDSQRKADLKRMQTALELYFADFRSYPISDASGTPGNWEWVNPAAAGIGSLEPSYINPLPADPDEGPGTNPGPCSNITNNRYNYRSDGSYYYLTSIMEVTTSAEDSPCDGLTINCGASYLCEDVCYFTQNP
ncbi:type II secretion system protein [Patescibacteria group bacterium]